MIQSNGAVTVELRTATGTVCPPNTAGLDPWLLVYCPLERGHIPWDSIITDRVIEMEPTEIETQELSYDQIILQNFLI